MPHWVACRTKGDHRDADRAADDAAVDVRSNHPHNPNAHRRSRSARLHFVILVVSRREVVVPPRVTRGGHRRGAAQRARDRFVRSTRSGQARPA
jgi:hypothetical protein